mmetsp:Transcript_10148/g.15257  ORF Transcript_10148/g.15257 Transcript_10148/m.15257 type:complete len:97 (+) Transcript_10148:2017-2307(+)
MKCSRSDIDGLTGSDCMGVVSSTAEYSFTLLNLTIGVMRSEGADDVDVGVKATAEFSLNDSKRIAASADITAPWLAKRFEGIIAHDVSRVYLYLIW